MSELGESSVRLGRILKFVGLLRLELVGNGLFVGVIVIGVVGVFVGVIF